MATRQHTTAKSYSCPNCHGVIAFDGATWGCADCDYVPLHSAD